MEERCVCCGDIIPEGRQVCPACWDKYTAPEPREERTIPVQSDLKEAFERLNEAAVNAKAALKRYKRFIKERRRKNGRR